MASDPQPRAPAPPSRPKPGRPLSAKVGDAILEAAVDVLTRKGIRGLTLDAVAARARVGKPTIYRRWPSKEALVAALIRIKGAALPCPDTGSTRDDLVTYLQALNELLATPAPHVVKGLFSEILRSPVLAEAYHETVAARRALNRTILERGVARGELRPGIDYDLALDMLAGPTYMRLLVTGEPIPGDYAQRVVDAILEGFAAS